MSDPPLIMSPTSVAIKGLTIDDMQHLSLNTTSKHLTDESPDTGLEPSLSTSTDNTPSRFMNIPRELRDDIYDLLKNDIAITSTPHSLKPVIRATVVSGPRSALLRVSKQFSREYKERVRTKAALCILDASTLGKALDFAVVELALPPTFCCVPRVHLQIYSTELGGHVPVLREMEAQACEWIERLRVWSSEAIRIWTALIMWPLDETTTDHEALKESIQAAKSVVDANESEHDPVEGSKFLGRLTGSESVRVVELKRNKKIPPDVTTIMHERWSVRQGWVSQNIKKDDGQKKNDNAAS